MWTMHLTTRRCPQPEPLLPIPWAPPLAVLSTILNLIASQFAQFDVPGAKAATVLTGEQRIP